MAKLRRPHFTAVPNEVIDDFMRELSEPAFRVLMAALRKTLGFQKTEDWISLSQFVKMTGLAENSVRKGIAELGARGLLSRVMRQADGETAKYVKTDVPYYSVILEDDTPLMDRPPSRIEPPQSVRVGGSIRAPDPLQSVVPTKERDTKETSTKETPAATASERKLTREQTLINHYAEKRGMKRDALYSGATVKIVHTILRKMEARNVDDIPGWVDAFLALPEEFQTKAKDFQTFARDDVADLVWKKYKTMPRAVPVSKAPRRNLVDDYIESGRFAQKSDDEMINDAFGGPGGFQAAVARALGRSMGKPVNVGALVAAITKPVPDGDDDT